jgi:Fe-S cluster assembly protein SufD
MPAAETTPSWLSDLRATALAEFGNSSPPTDEEEIWRYSRINDVDLSSYAATASTASRPALGDTPDGAAVVDIVDGHIVSISGGELDGATVQSLVDHADGAELYGATRGDADTIGLLHDANLADAVVIDVPRGKHVANLVVIDTWADADGGLTCPHTIIRAAAGSSVTVLERRRSGDANQLVIPVVEIDAAPDARVGYLVVQELGRNTISLEAHTSQAGQQAHVVSSVAAFGGSYARTRADFRLIGRGASGDLLSAYFGDGDQMLDFRTFQEHAAPDTTSTLLFKGAVTGKAQSVYSGLIRVSEDAPGTNAFQTNRNLKLSDDAWAYSVPNLEIEQNQVSCSHASTVGEIDEDQRFYLESRGVPTTIAEQLLVSGFFAEVIGQMPVDSVKAELQSTIDAALAADREAQEVSA